MDDNSKESIESSLIPEGYVINPKKSNPSYGDQMSNEALFKSLAREVERGRKSPESVQIELQKKQIIVPQNSTKG